MSRQNKRAARFGATYIVPAPDWLREFFGPVPEWQRAIVLALIDEAAEFPLKLEQRRHW